MENCGIGACSADKTSCASSITSMVVDTLSGAFDAVTLVASFGTSAAVTTAGKAAMKGGVEKIGKTAAQAAAKQA